MGKNRIAPKLKEQIIKSHKKRGVTVVQTAKDHGVSEHTIYGWIAKKADGMPTLYEVLLTS
jgi:transposase-like protein